MNLLLRRRPTVKQTTLGRLSLDGVHECDVLEDAIRETVSGGVPVSEWKKHGITAIPAGIYKLALVNSTKFGPDTLTLLNVPGFDLIRIHSLNDDSETEGCLGVGTATDDPAGDGGNLVNSKIALAALKAKVVPVLKAGQDVRIEVRNP